MFGDEQHMSTDHILTALHNLEESPWGDLKGRPMDARGLSRRLRQYDVRPTTIREMGKPAKGYRREDLFDAWQRYLSPLGSPPNGSVTSVTLETAG